MMGSNSLTSQTLQPSGMVKASSNVMRQTGCWRSKGAWDSHFEKTTVVLTGVPKTLGAEILLSLLDGKYFGCYDYVYLPMDMDKLENVGIAYVNFHEHSKAVECQHYFSGFSRTAWPGGHFSERNCRAEWSYIQGYEANIQRQKLNDWMNSNIPEDFKPMVFDADGFRLPTKEIFLQESQAYQDSHGWKGSKTHQTQSDGFGKGQWRWQGKWYGWSDPPWRDQWRQSDHGWRNWDGWNGRQDGWSNSHFQSQRHFAMEEETSNGHVNSESVPVLGRETRPWSQGVEGAGPPSQDAGAMNAKVPELFQVVQFGEPAASEALAPLAVARYACPSCSASFAKWSACHRHVSFACHKESETVVDVQELQARCKEKAEKLSAVDTSQASHAAQRFQ